MSFESGKKLGLIATIIYVTMPAILAVLYGFFIFSLIAAFSFAFRGGGSTSPFGFSFLSFGIIEIAFAVVGLISLIGLIMFIVAMYQLSQYYNEPGIFKNTICSLVVSIVGGVTLIATVLAVIISTITIQRVSTTPTLSPAAGLFSIGLLAIIGIAFVIGIVSALFYKRAFNKLGEKSGVHSFDTAGLLILIGVIIPLVSWIGWIFAISGFYSLKPKPTESSFAYYTNPTAPPTTLNKNCPHCGTANSIDATYCKNCGNKLL
ncbi:MAG: DUF996 domain-containing protein [Candidatus Bathyarchaeia archaeon]|jgi:uncharacterized membrane protein